MRVIVACESSGRVREAFRARGHDAWSCDLLPTDQPGNHYQGSIFDILGDRWDLLIAHPPCTYLTVSAAWAFKDPDYNRFPGVGYHQKVKAGTLVGEARREARREALVFARKLFDFGIKKVGMENPVGNLSTPWRQPDQIIHPWQFGHDASKATCLWLKGLPLLRPTNNIQKPKGERYANQSPNGQNKLPPSDDRWKLRSETYQGIADAMAAQWGGDPQPQYSLFGI